MIMFRHILPNSLAPVLVTGAFQGTVDFGGGHGGSAGNRGIFLARYSADGAPDWSKKFGDTDPRDHHRVDDAHRHEAELCGGDGYGKPEQRAKLTRLRACDLEGFGHEKLAQEAGAKATGPCRGVRSFPLAPSMSPRGAPDDVPKNLSARRFARLDRNRNPSRRKSARPDDRDQP